MSSTNSMSPEGEKLMKAVVLAQVERENAKLYEMAIKNLQRGQKTVGPRGRSLSPPSSSDRTPTPSPSPPPSPVRKKKGKKKKKMKMKMRKEDEEVKDEEVKDEDEEDEEEDLPHYKKTRQTYHNAYL